MRSPTADIPPAARTLSLPLGAPLAFGLCVVTLLVLSAGRLAAPHLWAEDGTHFLPQALAGRWSTLLEPLGGYFHLAGRLVAQAALLFPLRTFPTVATVAWVLVYAAAAALVARPAYRELIPSDGARVLLAWALCFVPGLHEILGTLCNLHLAVTLGAWLIAMKPPGQPLARWELGWVALAALSGGEAVVLVPLFAWRALERCRAKPAPMGPRWQPDALAVAMFVLVAAVNLSMRARQPPVPAAAPAQLVSALEHLVLNYVVYQPWLGPGGTAWLGAHANRNFFPLWGALALLAAGVVLVRRRERLDVQLLLGVAAWLAVVALTWLVRPIAVAWWDRQALGPVDFEHRYAFDLAPAALLFWTALLRPRAADSAAVRSRPALLLGVGFLVLNVAVQLAALRPIGPFRGQQAPWDDDAARLEAALRAGAPTTVSFPIPPYGGWHFEYEVGRH